MTSADDFALQLALQKGLLAPASVAAARSRLAAHTDAPTRPAGLLDLLISEQTLDPRRLTDLLAAECGLSTIDLPRLRVPAEVLALVPRETATRHQLIPVARQGPILRVAVADPLSVDPLDRLGHQLSVTIEPVLASARDIRDAIDRHYGCDGATAAPPVLHRTPPAHRAAPAPSGSPTADVIDANDAPIIQLVHAIILEAVQRRASDIHLEPLETRFRVRYRIDGVLLEASDPPRRLQAAILSRLKIMANLSIAEKRLPQDGRIQVALAAKRLDLRVSTLPTAHGESVVLRILDQEGLQLGLPELGFFSDDQSQLERLITLPDGLVLVTGPTGSGKTTTLYSCLHHINQPDRKIITVEDPVEYQLSGINQVPVRPEVGMTFAAALRAMLRQAPNIVMVGEIRDRETAEIAINASLTGHLVFSTLHTNDAAGAITRLIDVGIKPFLVASALRAVLAQRLVRRVCPRCTRPHAPDARERRLLNLPPGQLDGAVLAKGTGCAHCGGTGFRGRLGLVEILVSNPPLQQMIHDRIGTARLRDAARAQGMRTLREDGVRKVLAGLTTIDEVVSATVGEALATPASPARMI